MMFNVLHLGILLVLISIELIFLFYFAKSFYFFISDGADLRLCSISQYTMFLLLFTIECFYYLITGNTNQLFVYICRIYVFVSIYLLFCCRVIGYKSLFSSDSTKSYLYLISSILFYVVLIGGMVSMTRTPIVDTSFNNFDRISQVTYFLQYNCNKPDKAFVRFIPSVCSLPMYLVILYLDIKEKRSRKTYICDALVGLSLVMLFINSLPIMSDPYDKRWLLDICSCFMFILPIIGFIRESKSILHYCSKDKDIYRQVKQLVVESSKLTGNKLKYSARLLAKMLKDNPRLEEGIPVNKKYEKFITLVNEYLDKL